jgi:hypothetical protein
MSDVKRREAADRIAAKYYSDRSEEGAPDIEGWLSQPRIYEHMSIALDIAVDRDALEARLERAVEALRIARHYVVTHSPAALVSEVRLIDAVLAKPADAVTQARAVLPKERP